MLGLRFTVVLLITDSRSPVCYTANVHRVQVCARTPCPEQKEVPLMEIHIHLNAALNLNETFSLLAS